METKHSGEYKPPKKRKNKTKKNQKTKKPKPKSTQSLKPFFSYILFCKDMSLLQQTNEQHPPQVQCNFPTWTPNSKLNYYLDHSFILGFCVHQKSHPPTKKNHKEKSGNQSFSKYLWERLRENVERERKSDDDDDDDDMGLVLKPATKLTLQFANLPTLCCCCCSCQISGVCGCLSLSLSLSHSQLLQS